MIFGDVCMDKIKDKSSNFLGTNRITSNSSTMPSLRQNQCV